MTVTQLILLIAGMALAAVAVWNIRLPLTRLRELDRLADNARRYDSWRGGRGNTAAGDETTGADIMRQLLRRQVYQWAAVGLAALVLLIGGFALR